MSIHKTFKPREGVAGIDAAPLSVTIAPRPSWPERLGRWLANARARGRLLRCQSIDPRLARDIGLSQVDLLRESRAPFWEAVRRR